MADTERMARHVEELMARKAIRHCLFR